MAAGPPLQRLSETWLGLSSGGVRLPSLRPHFPPLHPHRLAYWFSSPSAAFSKPSSSSTDPDCLLRLPEHKRHLFIKTEPTPNSDSIKFVPGKTLLENGTADFPTAMAAVTSPLAKRLFRIEGVKRVFVGPEFVTVTKQESADWEVLKTIVFADLMEFFQSGEPVLSAAPPPSDTQILPEDSETVAMIKELLETRIRPSVQDDGGDIVYLGFVEGVVFVQLQGACSGCSSSSVTLKNGIERMMQHWIPEVVGVAAVESAEEFERIAGEKAKPTEAASQ